MTNLVLASQSPRREEILKQIGLNFTIVPSKVNEAEFKHLSPIKMVKRLALKKAEEVAKLVEDALIIGADTVVYADKKIIGKPKTKLEAQEILSDLQGKKHDVISGIALLNSKTNEYLLSYDLTTVYFRQITEEEISAYLKTKEGMDKAGAYGIQGLGAVFIEKIEGSYYTVMGLPVHKLYLILKEFACQVF